MQLESSGDLLSRIYFLLIHPTEHLFLTSFNLTRALKRVQVYLNYFHSTGTQQVAQMQLLVGVIGSFEKSRLEQ